MTWNNDDSLDDAMHHSLLSELELSLDLDNGLSSDHSPLSPQLETESPELEADSHLISEHGDYFSVPSETALDSATQHWVKEYLGADDDSDGNNYIDIDDGAGVPPRPRHSETWASDLSDHLSSQGIETQPHCNASPSNLLVDLMHGRQVMLPEPESVEVTNEVVSHLLDEHGGRVVWAQRIDMSDPAHPEICLVDHVSQGIVEPAAYSVAAFTHNDQPQLDYVATAEPPHHIAELAPEFNDEAGFFEQASQWMINHAPQLAVAFVGAGIGHEVGEIFNSSAAGVVGHYATERSINHVLSLDDDNHQHQDMSQVDDPPELGVNFTDDQAKDNFLNKL